MFSLAITIFYLSSRCTLGEVRQHTTARPPGNTTFVCFQHRNRKLLGVACTHHLLQHVVDLTKGRLSSLIRVYAPTGGVRIEVT